MGLGGYSACFGVVCHNWALGVYMMMQDGVRDVPEVFMLWGF